MLTELKVTNEASEVALFLLHKAGYYIVLDVL